MKTSITLECYDCERAQFIKACIADSISPTLFEVTRVNFNKSSLIRKPTSQSGLQKGPLLRINTAKANLGKISRI